MNEKIMISLDKRERQKLSLLAKHHRMTVPRLIRTWIDKEIKDTDEVAKENQELGDLLSCVTLKEPYTGLSSHAAMRKVLENKEYIV